MRTPALLTCGVVALLHVYFFVLESFLWDTPYGRRVFGLSHEVARASRTLAQNQGVYNAFLAAGIIWGMTLGAAGRNILVFFLACVIVAGIVGAFTANKKILFVQAIPALFALFLVMR